MLKQKVQDENPGSLPTASAGSLIMRQSHSALEAEGREIGFGIQALPWVFLPAQLTVQG